MENLFLFLLNNSITAGYLVLAVLLLRPLLKKAPKYIRCILWSFVGLRLILPFSVESIFSLIPSAEPIPQEILYESEPTIHTGISFINSTVNPILSESMAPDVGASVNPMQVAATVAGYVWLLGVIALVVYALISYIRLRKKLREAVREQGNIWLCDRIPSPFLLGIFKPRIYLPSALPEADREYVIAHENAHIRRKDHWWKPLGFLLLTVYWFNPLMWIAYIFLCRDIEFACDEKVIRELGADSRQHYSEALIHASVSRKMISACPVAFGEEGVKGRIKSVLNYKKPAFWIILISLLVCTAVAVCFLTNPLKKDDSQKIPANEYRFRATVVEINEDSLLVEPLEKEEYFDGAKQVVIRLNGKSKDNYRIGCIVEVIYDSQLEESMPPIIPNASSIFNLDLVSSSLPDPHYSFTATVTKVLSDCIIVKYQHFPLHNFEFSEYRVITDPTDYTLGDKVNITYDGKVLATSTFPLTLGTVYDIQIISHGHNGTDTDFSFFATVIAVHEDSLLVEPVSGESELEISEQFIISTTTPFDYDIGERVHIQYDGKIEEADPPVIPNILILAQVVDSYFLATDPFGIADHAIFDIDSDGIMEDCYVSPHPLTGVCVMIICAYENGILEYCNFFYPENHYEFSFQNTEDGKTSIAATAPDSSYNSQVYTISVQDCNIVLTNKKDHQIEYWSTDEPFAPTLRTVKKLYPHFHGLSTFKGLEVYVWKNGDWRCGVRRGTNRNAELDELHAFGEGATLQEMAIILGTYGIPKEEISISYTYNPAFSGENPTPPTDQQQAYIEETLSAYLPIRLSTEPYFPPEFSTVDTYPLVICAYKLAENSWRFQFYEKSTIFDAWQDSVWGLDGIDVEDAKKKLANYDIPPKDIPVIVINSYISSYYHQITKQTVIDARNVLGLS